MFLQPLRQRYNIIKLLSTKQLLLRYACLIKTVHYGLTLHSICVRASFMKTFLLFIFVLFSATSFAQYDTVRIPIDRQYFHDKIVAQQEAIDKMDGQKDGLLTVSKDQSVNLQLSDVLFRRVKEMRYAVETNKLLPERNDKVRYLRYIESMLKQFTSAYQSGAVDPLLLPALIDNFEEIKLASFNGKSVLPIVKKTTYPIALINIAVFDDLPESREAKNIVYLKYIALHPDKILLTIRPYSTEPFADSLIVAAANYNPVQLYSFAQSKSSPEGKLIHRNTDPTVIMVSKLSQMPTALNYFPFLDNLLHQKQSIEEIKKYLGDGENNYDSVGYYKLLVKTEIDYAKRLMKKDTPIAMFGVNGLRDVLKNRAIRHFITPINVLHNLSVNIRMKAIQPLSAEELYYMIVMGENDIYTSSYKHSFARMLQQMSPQFHGDSLLLKVNFDYFKKFVKMAANYNKLDQFLGTMSSANSAALMRAFVNNLDKGNNLEDAVDVADAYSSIVNPELRKTMMGYVEDNENQAIKNGNTRGKIIYNLLHIIFESANEPGEKDLTSTIGIPSIYEVKNKSLQDDKGRIVQQVFFYGDEDGKTFFPPFVNSFPTKDWIVNPKAEWVEIKSRQGEVYIYANKPLDSDKNLDDSAQVHLAAYMKSQGMNPSIVVHRGHSYWLQGTIDRMPSDAKIVVLGSCGGYKNLSDILYNSPDAHIISTKETGAGDINRPILNYMNQTLITGKTLEWRPMWATLSRLFADDPNKDIRETWEDYIPPYKNLGAIFIKAYNKKMEQEENL